MIGPREREPDPERDRKHHGRQQDQPDRGHDQVKRALDRKVDPLEHRRAQGEQRHGLAGHELGPVDQDLHRGRRDLHGHPTLVADVDELNRALLGEVGVGDDHLLDALGIQDLGEPVDLAERAQPVLGARLQREVADEVDAGPGPAGQRVRDRLDVLARPDQHGAAPVTGLGEDPAGHPQCAASAACRCRRRRRTASRRRCSSWRSGRHLRARAPARSPPPETTR